MFQWSPPLRVPGKALHSCCADSPRPQASRLHVQWLPALDNASSISGGCPDLRLGRRYRLPRTSPVADGIDSPPTVAGAVLASRLCRPLTMFPFNLRLAPKDR